MNYALILAGGIGSRFWPLSNSQDPKQFLNLYSSRPMLEETIHRLRRLIKKENIYIATNQKYYQKIKNCVRNLKLAQKNILFEPQARNTFAPIAVLSKRIKGQDPQAVILVLPCDHLVKDQKKFITLLKEAIEVASQDRIVTLGIPPRRPETGYGYIKINPKAQSRNLYLVDKFVEKPNLKTAERFLKDKRYYWNSGIFIFKAKVMLEEIQKLAPSAYKIVAGIKERPGLLGRANAGLTKLWHKLPSISIDFAIMEKTNRLALLAADYGWMDLGSWQAIAEVFQKNRDGNTLKGKCISVGDKNTFIWSDNRLVATLGLKDIIVVNTKDALLVCAKDKTQDVKKIAQRLSQ